MRAAIYARVSTPRQARERRRPTSRSQGLSITPSRRRWDLEGGRVYLDEGYSGANLNRPGLDALRDAAAMAEFEVVLVAAPDRLARNYVHQVLLLEELQGRGCRVEFLERPMSQDPNDQLLLQIRGAVAEYERTLIAERMRRGRLAKLRSGQLLPWLRVPFGYRTDPERPRDPAGLRVEEYEATIVRQMFAWYLEQGATLGGVARRLVAAGVLTPTGKSLLVKEHHTWHPQESRLRRQRLRPLHLPGAGEEREDRRFRPWARALPPSGAQRRSGSTSRSPRSSRGRPSIWYSRSSPTTANSPRATTRATDTF